MNRAQCYRLSILAPAVIRSCCSEHSSSSSNIHSRLQFSHISHSSHFFSSHLMRPLFASTVDQHQPNFALCYTQLLWIDGDFICWVWTDASVRFGKKVGRKSHIDQWELLNNTHIVGMHCIIKRLVCRKSNILFNIWTTKYGDKLIEPEQRNEDKMF